jgi:hypothetical protein
MLVTHSRSGHIPLHDARHGTRAYTITITIAHLGALATPGVRGQGDGGTCVSKGGSTCRLHATMRAVTYQRPSHTGVCACQRQ